MDSDNEVTDKPVAQESAEELTEDAIPILKQSSIVSLCYSVDLELDIIAQLCIIDEIEDKGIIFLVRLMVQDLDKC